MNDDHLDGRLLSRQSPWTLYVVAWSFSLAILVGIVFWSSDHTLSAEAQPKDRQTPQTQTPAPAAPTPTPPGADHYGITTSTFGTSGEGSTAGAPGTTGESTSGNSGRPIEPTADEERSKTR